MVGTTVSHYRVLKQLGSGGMGVVYQAEDSRLGRLVAIKFLNQSGSGLDLARFQREAKAASSLNHPNICTLYDIGEHDGHPFLVMEYLQGSTLADRIGNKPLPLEMALDLAYQCTDALAVAHEAQLMHRDIKPANIFVVSRGPGVPAQAKILDFGLAKYAGQESDPGVETALTAAGSTVGTVAYMSPEQARGETLDIRTDIFSFGCVLYEMLTGARPFAGPTHAMIFDAILNRTPDAPSRLNNTVPAALNEIVFRALQKKANDRYQSAADLRVALGQFRQASSAGHTMPVAETARVRSWWPVAAVVTAVAVLAAGGAYMLRKPAAEPPAPVMQFTEATNSGHSFGSPLAPDGKYLAYLENRNGEVSGYVKPTAGGSAVRVLEPPGVQGIGPFSADGNSLYFSRTDSATRVTTLYRMPVLGGAATQVLTDFAGASFSSDGTKLVFIRNQRGGPGASGTSSLMLANADGAAESTLTTRELNAGFRRLALSRDGRTVAATSAAGLELIPTAGGPARQLPVPSWWNFESVQWTPSGLSLLITAEEVSAGMSGHHQILEVATAGGKVTRLTNDLNDYHQLTATRDQSLLAATVLDYKSNIWIAPANSPDQAVKTESGTTHGAKGVAWTQDGRLVFADNAATGWLMNVDGTGLRLFSPDRRAVANPMPCGPGTQFAFLGGRGPDHGDIFVGDPDRGTVRKAAEAVTAEFDCSPDGQYLFYTSKAGVVKIPVGGGEVVVVAPDVHSPLVSPDGKWLAVHRRNSGKPGETWALKSLIGGADAGSVDGLPVSGVANSENAVRWTPDSAGFLFSQSEKGVENLWMLPRAGGARKQVTHFTSDRVPQFAYSQDGRRLAIVRAEILSDIVLIHRK